MAGAEIGQAKRAVVEYVREFRPDGSQDGDDELALLDEIAVLRNEIDLELAIRGFSVDISVGDEAARSAADALGWLGDPRGISPLLRALADAKPAVRLNAAFALKLFAELPEWVVAPLGRGLQDDDPGVRANAAAALADVARMQPLMRLYVASTTRRAGSGRALPGLLGIWGSTVTAASVPSRSSARCWTTMTRAWRTAFWGLRGQAGSASDAGALRGDGQPTDNAPGRERPTADRAYSADGAVSMLRTSGTSGSRTQAPVLFRRAKRQPRPHNVGHLSRVLASVSKRHAGARDRDDSREPATFGRSLLPSPSRRSPPLSRRPTLKRRDSRRRLRCGTNRCASGLQPCCRTRGAPQLRHSRDLVPCGSERFPSG